MRFHFPIIIIDEDFRSENTSGLGIRALAKAIEEEGMEVLGVTSYGDLTSFAQQQSRGSTFILSIDDEEFSSPEAAAQAIAGQFVELGESGVRLRPYRIRYLFPEQLDAAAATAGLGLVDRWADWDRRPFTGDSPNHVSVYAVPLDPR